MRFEHHGAPTTAQRREKPHLIYLSIRAQILKEPVTLGVQIGC